MSFLIRSIAIAAASMAAASSVFAQAPVVDLSQGSIDSRAPVAYPQQLASRVAPAAERSRAQANPQADAYYQMQLLQQEVQELRGIVEELKHEVKRLRQQRTEDYMDLDRRLARLSGEAPSAAPSQGAGSDSGAAVTAPPSIPPVASNTAASEDEKSRYNASFGLARKGDYAGASKGFKSLLEDYPNGQFAPNANYWLGEVALVQGNIEEARQWFVALLDGYPNSSKIWDGRYKLGTVYHQLGDQARAKELLEQVAASDARAANLAKQYLQDNF